MDLINNTIQVESVSVEPKRIKITDQKNLVYSILKNKQDGNPTKAYLTYQSMGDIAGTMIEVSYKESPAPQGGTYRNIAILDFSDEEPQQKQPLRVDKEEKPQINDNIQHNITRGMAFNNAVKIFIANKKLDWTTDEWDLNLENLVNKLVDVVNGKNTKVHPTPKDKDDNLPF